MEPHKPIPLGSVLEGYSLIAMDRGKDSKDDISASKQNGSDGFDLRPLETAIGYRFFGRRHAVAALTHSSMRVSPEGRRVASESYERLEFLGDRVLGLVISEMLLFRFPLEREGDLAKRHTELVRRETLAEVAVSLKLGPMIRMSRGEKDGGGQQKESLLADVVEALIAAMYLDGGMSPVRTFIEKNWSPFLEAAKRPPRDPKTTLQEWAQARSLPLPVYEIVSQSGPSHEPQFEISVTVEGQKPVVATAGNKRAAEREAASVLLERVVQARDAN